MGFLRESRRGTVTILNAGTVSTAFQTYGAAMFGAIIPAGFEGTTLSFQVADYFTGSTYVNLEDGAGVDISLTLSAAGADKAVALPDELASYPAFKLVAGAQTGDVDIIIVAKA